MAQIQEYKGLGEEKEVGFFIKPTYLVIPVAILVMLYPKVRNIVTGLLVVYTLHNVAKQYEKRIMEKA